MLWCLLLLLVEQPMPVREQVQQGYAQAERGDLGGAETTLRRAIKSAPRNAYALGVLGLVLSRQGKHEEAARYLQQAVAIDPNDLGARFSLATTQLQLHQPELARQNLELILKVRPDTQQAKRLLAVALEMGQYDEASALLTAGRTADARALLDRMVAAGARDPGVYHLLAVCMQRQNQRDEALAALRRALELAPNDAALHAAVARHLLDDGNLKAARALAAKSLELAPEHPQALKVQGIIDIRNGDPKSAVTNLERAAALDPSDPEMPYWLGTADRMLFRYDDARRVLTQGLAKFPQFAPLHEAWGRLLADPGAHPDAAATAAAIRAFEKALSLDATLAQSHYELGRLLLEEGKTATALAHLENAARLNPSDAPTQLALASAYRREGRTEDHRKALAAYRAIEERKRAAN